MLKMVKKQIMELLHTLTEAEQEIQNVIRKEDAHELVNVLADAQDAAVAIGGKVEETALIASLEQYCELLWGITQETEAGARLGLASEAWALLKDVERDVEQIPEEMAVVFMPYKASMWDCMESVWQAACEDPECVPFVVPIPYFDLKDGEVIARHYEGDRFPAYVPVTDYNGFPLEELRPDAVFVHNPFDDCNIVTSVLPQYYSWELKKNVNKLIYIPYFITGDGVFVTHRYFPSYENMDYIVTQCEKTIDSFASSIPREKFLPFGSPIADRVLRLEKEIPAIPEEWKPQLKNGTDFGGDRVVMLNTSISLLMKQRERFLDKIEYIFELAKQKEGITLVWRPHPLLEATAQNMGEKFVARLNELEKKFREEKIGVLDKNPDVGVTVAHCDAYLGETASSVIHMFGVAGKPRFHTGLQIPVKGKKEEAIAAVVAGGETAEMNSVTERRIAGSEVYASAWCRAGDREYYVLDRSGWIVEKEAGQAEGEEKYRPVVHIPGREIVRGRAYKKMELKDDSLWLYPDNAEGIFIYHLRSERMRKVFVPEGDVCRDDLRLLKLDDECLSFIRAEKFKRGNHSHVWYENENSSVDDFFRFLQTADDNELTGVQGSYAAWIANLDGSCGEKIWKAVKESCNPAC